MSPGLDDFLAQYDKRNQPDTHPPPNGVPSVPPGAAEPYARAALTREVAILAGTAPGGRNDQLNESAFNLAQLVAGGHLPRQPTWDTLHATALSIGLEPGETHNTLTSAFEAGEQQPRQVPELFDPDDVTVLDTPVVDDLLPELVAIDWHALWADESTEEWIVEPLLPARRLVALFSPPKIGKSLLMLEVAVAVSRGEDVLGATVDRPRRVLYVDFENDPRGDIRTRLQAMERKPDELADLAYLSFPRLPALDTAMGGLVLLGAVEKFAAEVVVIDTISRIVQGEENDNDTWLNFYRHTGVALKARGVATIRLDHTGKDPTKGMRGGSAKYGDVDVVWSMTPVGERLRLECTAHRLPVPRKDLMLTRELYPLRHTVAAPGSPEASVVGAKQAAIITDLDELAGPDAHIGPTEAVTGRGAIKALRDQGRGYRDEDVRDAIHKREELLTPTVLRFPGEGDS